MQKITSNCIYFIFQGIWTSSLLEGTSLYTPPCSVEYLATTAKSCCHGYSTIKKASNINYKYACARNYYSCPIERPWLKIIMQTWKFYNRIIFWKPQEHHETSTITLSCFSLKGHTGTAETTASQMLTKFIDFFTFGLQIINEVLQPTLLGQPLAITDIFYINIQTTCQAEMQLDLLTHRI